MFACYKLQSLLAKTVVKCLGNKSSFLQIMPKRLIQSWPQSKKIKLSKNLKDSVNFSSANSSYSNLKSNICDLQEANNSEAKMTVVNVLDDVDIPEHEIEYLDTPVKSESDKKDYRVIKLENGLTALLISDEKSIPDGKEQVCSSAIDEDSDEGSTEESENEGTEDEEDDDEGSEDGFTDKKAESREEKMAACALCVGVGSFSDPNEIKGMAHFLEHMVFMGSERFPEENDFDTFIKKRGGSSNASTDCEQTTFYFEIQEKHLLPAMDRFAQFFVSPLMKRDAITREREAVESEFKMALPSDSNRKEQLFCSLARKDHPAGKFAWGNLITLRDEIDEDTLYAELHKFRERHYSAHRMTLAVQARLSLDELEQYVMDCFAEVPTNHLPSDDFSNFKGKDSFDNSKFRKIYKVKPIKDVCQVELTWVMPPLHDFYKSKPHQYVSWIIGHEGKGSLIDYLRKKMWCLDIFSGNSEGGFEHSSLYALFSLSLTLTDAGYEHFKEILEAIFSYLNMLRREGPQIRIFNEIQQIEEVNFRFTDEDDPADYVESLCENMHFYPPADYLTGSDLYFEYNPEAIKSCIDDLSPENVNIILFNKTFNEDEFDKIEPWFKTKYQSVEIPSSWTESWKTIEPLPEFHLPLPNVYITTNFDLIELPALVSSYPQKIHKDDNIEIWYRPDPKFRLPEAYIYLHLLTPSATESAEKCALLHLFVAVLKHLIVADLYDASAAELNYEIKVVDRGINVKVYGFNQKLHLLLKSILKCIADCHKLATKELFDVLKKDQLKMYYNTFLKPAKLNNDVRLSILTSGLYTATEKHSATADITFEQFIDFAKHLLDLIYIQCLAQGNLTQTEILKSIFECIEPLNHGTLSFDARPQINVREVPVGEKCCRIKNFNPMDVNSVVTNYYQSGLKSIQSSVVIELLMMIMEEPLFNQLRTQEQLGYNVYCIIRETFGVLGYSITVCTQANKFMTDHIDERIENFIQCITETLKNMPEDEFLFIKESLIKVKQCTDIHLREEVNRNWGEIIHGEYIFDRYEKEIAAIKNINIDQVRKWIIDHSTNGSNFRKLTVQVVGNSSADANVKGDKDTPAQGTVKYSVTYLTEQNNEKNKPSDYFITDIENYKKDLNVYPVTSASLP